MNTNLRYKQGKNLGYDGDKVMIVSRPEKLFLPKLNVSTSYVFAIEDQFFAYPNNYNYYVNFYKDTFQHGGVSMEEMIIPIIFLTSKNAFWPGGENLRTGKSPGSLWSGKSAAPASRQRKGMALSRWDGIGKDDPSQSHL